MAWRITAALVVLMGVSALPAAEKLDPALPYQGRKLSPVTYEVDYALVLTPPAATKELKVWLPLPPSDAAQEVTAGELSAFPLAVKPTVASEKVYGNRFACFVFEKPLGAQLIRHRFRAKVWEMRWGLDPGKVAKVPAWPKGFEPYLRSGTSEDRLARFAKNLVKGGGPAGDLDAVIDWLHGNMRYSSTKASLTADPLRSFEAREGNCVDYHGLCSSFGRALGVPTRVMYGLSMLPKNSPSHCKMEAYLPPYGWVSFDVSETQKMVLAVEKDGKLSAAEKEQLMKAARDRLRGGFRDNTWLMYTRGTDYDLAPPAAGKVSIVRTAYAEADGKPLPDPDPSDPGKREFAWMTVLRCVPDREVTYPFADRATLGK